MIVSSPVAGSLAASPVGFGVRKNSQSPIRSRAGTDFGAGAKASCLPLVTSTGSQPIARC